MCIGYNVKGKSVGDTTRTILLTLISKVYNELKEKGFLNNWSIPTRNERCIKVDLWNILENHLFIQRGILNHYAMINNSGRLWARAHYSLKYSCAWTISYKIKLITMRGIPKKYRKDFRIKRDNKSISFFKIEYACLENIIFNNQLNFSKIFDKLIFRFRCYLDSLKKRVLFGDARLILKYIILRN